MGAWDPLPGTGQLEAASVVGRPSLGRSALALMERDLLLIRRTVPDLLMRSLVQPLLFVFVFAYVYPKIGVALGSGEGGDGISTIILPGVMAFSALFCGIYSVGLPLAMDLGLTREVDDRALAPVPTIAIPLVRLASGGGQALIAASIVPPMMALVAANGPNMTGWNIALLLSALFASGLCAAAIGVLMAGVVPTASLPAVLTVIHLPLTFLGAGYYSWAALGDLPALQVLLLLNPMTYVCEALRAALTPGVAHMEPTISVPVALAFSGVMAWIGSNGVARRIKDQGP